MEERKRGEVHSLAKALELLEIMNRSRSPMSLANLSRISGYPKSTIHAMLSTLRSYGCVAQSESGDYCPGIRLYEWGTCVMQGWDILPAARSVLEQLAAQTGSTALLSNISGNQVTVIDRVVNGDNIRVTTDVGRQLPLYATSQGKLLLASLPDATVHYLLKREDTIAYTPHTRVEQDDFFSELSRIRRQGYAVEDGEYKIGLRSVSAPIYDKANVLRYALSVVGLFRSTHCGDFDNAVWQACALARQLSDILNRKGGITNPQHPLQCST